MDPLVSNCSFGTHFQHHQTPHHQLCIKQLPIINNRIPKGTIQSNSVEFVAGIDTNVINT